MSAIPPRIGKTAGPLSEEPLGAVARGGFSAIDARHVRVSLRLALEEVVGAVEAARWPAAPRERLLAALRQGEPWIATVRGPTGRGIDFEVNGRLITLRLPAAAAGALHSGDTVQLALDGVAAAARGENAADSARLSDAARVFDMLSRQAPKARVAGGTAPPLLEAAPRGTALLAAALATGLARSGLFYESHLERWTKGGYPLAEVRKEPQAAAVLAWRTAGGEPPVALRPETWSDALTATVSRQLEAISRGFVGWEGMIWPGQSAAIEVREDGAGSSSGSGAESQGAGSWEAKLNIRLDSLGDVQVRVRLRGGRAHIECDASAAGASQRLAAERDVLAAALLAHGIGVERITVGSDE